MVNAILKILSLIYYTYIALHRPMLFWNVLNEDIDKVF